MCFTSSPSVPVYPSARAVVSSICIMPRDARPPGSARFAKGLNADSAWAWALSNAAKLGASSPVPPAYRAADSQNSPSKAATSAMGTPCQYALVAPALGHRVVEHHAIDKGSLWENDGRAILRFCDAMNAPALPPCPFMRLRLQLPLRRYVVEHNPLPRYLERAAIEPDTNDDNGEQQEPRQQPRQRRPAFEYPAHIGAEFLPGRECRVRQAVEFQQERERHIRLTRLDTQRGELRRDDLVLCPKLIKCLILSCVLREHHAARKVV